MRYCLYSSAIRETDCSWFGVISSLRKSIWSIDIFQSSGCPGSIGTDQVFVPVNFPWQSSEPEYPPLEAARERPISSDTAVAEMEIDDHGGATIALVDAVAPRSGARRIDRYGDAAVREGDGAHSRQRRGERTSIRRQ